MRNFLSQGPLFLVLAMVLILLSRLPFLSIGVYDPDEAVGVMVAQKILEGGLPYVDAIDHRGPLSYFFFAGIFAVAGSLNMTAVHVALILLVMGMAFLLYQLTKQVFSGQVAGWAALLFAVLSWAGKPTDMLAAHTEWLMGFWVLLGLLIWFGQDKRPPVAVLLGGLCMGMAALSKQVALWDWLVFPLGMAALLLRGSLNWSTAIRHSILAGLGFAIPLLSVMLGYGLSGQWEAFYAYAWQYNVEIYMPVLGLGRRLRNTWDLLMGFALGKSLLLGLSAAGMGILCQRAIGPTRKTFPDHQLILGLWALLALAGSLTGGRNFGHYLIQALPGLALMGGVALGEMQSFMKERAGIAPLLISLSILGLGYPMMASYGLYHRPWLHIRRQSATAQLVSYLRPEGEQGKSLFVWGFAPHYYAETGLHPASRFLYTTFQTGVVPVENAHLAQTDAYVMAGSWELLLQDLKAAPPDYLIDAAKDEYSFMGWHPISRYPELADWVQRHYQLDQTYHQVHPEHGALLYQRKKAAIPDID